MKGWIDSFIRRFAPELKASDYDLPPVEWHKLEEHTSKLFDGSEYRWISTALPSRELGSFSKAWEEYQANQRKESSMNIPSPAEQADTRPAKKIAGDSATGLLNKAKQIQEDRAKQYDQPEGERSMASTVSAFNIITKRTGNRALSESEGWQLMACLKMVRDRTTASPHRDSIEDLVSYCALFGEARLKETRFMPEVPVEARYERMLDMLLKLKNLHGTEAAKNVLLFVARANKASDVVYEKMDQVSGACELLLTMPIQAKGGSSSFATTATGKAGTGASSRRGSEVDL